MAEGIVPFQEVAKQQLLERCGELEFVDDVQDLKCMRCKRLALEHWYTNCGHALCPNCKRLLSGGRCRCPHCGQFIKHIEEQSADFEEKVNSLRAKCPNSRYGCPLTDTVKQLQEHLVGCKWTKEQVLPAPYRGANTMQILLEEVSSLKEQMGEMKGTNAFLLNELNERLKVEEEIKTSVEMSLEDIKSRLNGLSSDLHYETTTLKVQLKDFDQSKIKELLELKNTLALDINHKITTLEKTINEINLEKFKDHFVPKEEQKQMEDKIVSANATSNKVLIQMLDQKEDRFSEKLAKEVEALNTKIVASEGRMVAAVTNSRQETVAMSKNLQSIVEVSNKKLQAQWQELSSSLNQKLEQKEIYFNQKLSNDIKHLDDKMNKNQTAVEMNGKENHAKIKVIKSEITKQEVELKQQIGTNIKMMENLKLLREEMEVMKAESSQKSNKMQANFNRQMETQKKIHNDELQKLVTKVNSLESQVNKTELENAALKLKELDYRSGIGTKKEVNMLLLGQTGIGKSTFINALVYYLNCKDLKEATSADLSCVIPCSFALTDANYEETIITYGNTDDGNENTTNTRESGTQKCKSYLFEMDEFILRIIDTPAIGDTRGINQDKLNMENVLDYISTFKHLHGICILLSPEEPRLTATFEYCIKQLLCHLHKNASNNIMFVFTNSRRSFFKPGDTIVPLSAVIKKLKNSAEIPLSDNNIFCVDNEAFRYLIALKNNFPFENDVFTNFNESWKKSVTQYWRIIDLITDKDRIPHEIEETLTLNQVKEVIVSLSKAEFDISKRIQQNYRSLNRNLDVIRNFKEDCEKLSWNKTKLAGFLKQNAILPYNDAFCSYLKHLIENEESLKADGANNDSVIKGLKEMEEEYLKEIEFIENASCSSDEKISVEEAKRLMTLLNLNFSRIIMKTNLSSRFRAKSNEVNREEIKVPVKINRCPL